MSYEYGFADNEKYSAEDVNELIGSLVSSGVADVFEDGVPYNASKVNDIVRTVYSEGVVPESVGTLKVTKQSDGVISIAPGLAFFADGSTIRVTSAETLAYTAGAKNYVYLKQDLAAQNRNYPACTTDAPTGDFVLLAEIEADGTVKDKRTYAKGKVPGYQSNANCAMVIEQDIAVDEETLGKNGSLSFSVDMGTNNYSRVFVWAGDASKERGQMGVYSLTDGSYFCTCVLASYDQIKDDRLIIGSNGGTHPLGYLTFSVNGSELIGNFEWYASGYDTKTRHYTFTMVLC